MLELRNINKGFGEKQILSNFSLKIPEKQILAIVGPSGGGKTTLLRMLAGLETIDSGQIFYNGESLELGSNWRSEIYWDLSSKIFNFSLIYQF